MKAYLLWVFVSCFCWLLVLWRMSCKFWGLGHMNHHQFTAWRSCRCCCWDVLELVSNWIQMRCQLNQLQQIAQVDSCWFIENLRCQFSLICFPHGVGGNGWVWPQGFERSAPSRGQSVKLGFFCMCPAMLRETEIHFAAFAGIVFSKVYINVYMVSL